MKLKNIRLDKLNFSSTPVRLRRTETAMEELKQSIKATDGPIDPLIVRDMGTDEYIVVAGETRLKAMMELGYKTTHQVPCLIDSFSDEEALEYGLIENLVRQKLTPYEEALVVKRLVDDYGYQQSDLAKRLGKSKQQINNLLGVFSLINEVKEALHAGKITLGHARVLYALRDNKQKQKNALDEIIAKNLSRTETETLIKKLLGNNKDWFVKPGTVYISKNSKLSVHPSGDGFQFNGRFTNKEELLKIIKALNNRIKK